MATTWINRGHFYVPHVTPVLVDCNFTVANADAGGLGITGLKGQGVQNVFMHTTQTPGKGPNGKTNPNPAAGYIIVQLSDNFSRLYLANTSLLSPLSGSSLVVNATALTAGVVYVITAVGTSTAADWLALGVPPGVTPAVGVAFTALVTGTGSGSGTVQAIAAAGSGITHMEIVGTPSTSLGPIPVGGSPNVGGWLALACFAETASVNAIAAPANGTVIRLGFYLSQSSVTIAGE